MSNVLGNLSGSFTYNQLELLGLVNWDVMKNYFILWEEISKSELLDAEDIHFFALEMEGQVQYLGMCYGLNLVHEVEECMQIFNLEPKKVTISTGVIISNIHNVINQQIAEEILCLLVYNTKPLCNVICKRSYYGRDGLEVHNRGNLQLPEKVKADRSVVLRLTGS